MPHIKILKNKKTVFFVFVDEVIYAKAGTYLEVGAECLNGPVSGFLNLDYSSEAVGDECAWTYYLWEMRHHFVFLLRV